MNRRIKKKRSCLNGNTYRFKNYHTRRVVVHYERPFVKALVLQHSMWLFKFPTKWIIHKYPLSERFIPVYVNYCLKKHMPIVEAIGRYHEKLRKDDNNNV